MAPFVRTWMLALALLVALSGCEQRREHTVGAPAAPKKPSAKTPAPPSSRVQAAVGDAQRGRRLVEQFECNRCHDGTGLQAAAFEKHCVRCHEDIWQGKFRARTAAGDNWKDHIAHVRVAPSLEGVGRRLRPDYIESFLRDPHDVRPALAPSMPRLALNAEQVRDVVAHLVTLAPAVSRPDRSLEGADLEHGRQLLEEKGCGSCHSFSGVAALPTRPNPDAGSEQQRRAVQLAPDLRYARDRLRLENAALWIMDPRSLKSDTLMPASGLTRDEARDVAAYVLETPLAPAAPRQPPRRLPPLDRRVGFVEVQERVLGRTCGHCHGNADRALGDGGPGNTGGFGFAPRRLDLTSYGGVASGLLDDRGERHSVFDKLEDGTPRLVAALLARQAEEAGKPNPAVRGMPLGLPSLPSEDIQLVDTWIAQGRPR